MDTTLQPNVIAVVDDDQSIRTGLASLLRSCGWAVRTYDSGAGLLKELDQINIRLLISDIQMPGVDGFALVSEIAHRQNLPPVFLITAYVSGEVKERAGKMRVAGFFSKPLDNAKLLSCVEALLGSALF